MFKNEQNVSQTVITNGALQVVYVTGAGKVSNEPIKTYTEHLDIFLIFDGEIELKVFNKKRTLKPGDLFFCTRSTYAEVYIKDPMFSCARLRFIKDKLDGHSILKRFAASLLECEIVKQKIFNHCLSYIEFFEASREQMSEQEAKLVHQDNLEILSILDIMMSEEHENLDIVQHELTKANLVVEAINIFENNIEHTPKINSIVEQLGVSHSYFVRTFKRHVGVTPNIFSRTLKVNYSLSLISLKMESLCDISYLLGFSDQSHFSNCFKEYLQFTPGKALMKKSGAEHG